MSNIENSSFPIFLSGHPIGEDKFEGKAQDRIANVIVDLIRKDGISKKVIGLEGEWGSGKSNVIELIRKKLGESHYTFIFDAWGNQEDLTRRTFLEEIIGCLFRDKLLKDEDKWREKKEELLAKKSKKTIQVFPTVKTFWIFFMLSILSYAFCDGFYTNVFKEWDMIKSINAPILKRFLSIYLLPLGFGITGLILGVLEYKKQREDNEVKEGDEKENRFQTLGKMCYWLKGDNIDSTEKENIIDDEPSVRQFRKYFKMIQEDLGNTNLIIVFDNLDRLEHEKVRALWSSIHTFFAENPSGEIYKNTWVIVPYYKEKLTEIFDSGSKEEEINHRNGKGFIEKTFAVNFRVPPPVVTDWEDFLSKRLKDAFGKEIITPTEKDYVMKLFDRFTVGNTIKPREMINYVNQLVALYMQWKPEVEDKEIRFRYLALFVLTKDRILKKPTEEILSREYLGASSQLFTGDKNLDDSISALTFNVSKDKASEVLLKRTLTQAIRNGDTETIENSKSHKAFAKYFEDSYLAVGYNEKWKYISNIIELVSDKLNKSTINGYWKDFCYSIGNKLRFSEYHQNILLNVSKEDQKYLIKQLIVNVEDDISHDDGETKYYEEIVAIRAFLETNEINLSITDFIKTQQFKPKNFLHVAKAEGKKYSDLKIQCDESTLVDWFSDDEHLDITSVFNEIEAFKIVKKDYKFSKIFDEIAEFLTTVNYTDHEIIERSLKVLKALFSKSISLKLSPTFYNQAHPTNTDESVYMDTLAIAISDFDTAHNSQNFRNVLNGMDDDQKEELANILEWYFDYDDFLKLIVDHPASEYESLKDVASLITEKKTRPRIYLKTLTDKFQIISDVVFENDHDKIVSFIKKLNTCSGSYKTEEYFKDIPRSFFSYLNLQEIDLVKKITDDSINYVYKELDKDKILDALKERNRDYKIIKSLIENNLPIKFSDNFVTAFDNYLDELMQAEFDIPSSDHIVSVLPHRLDAKKLKTTYTVIGNKILESPSTIGYDRIEYVINEVINHGNWKDKPKEVTIKLVDYLFDDNEAINLIFSKHVEFLTNAVLNSGEYLEGTKAKIAGNLNIISSEEAKVHVIERLNIKVPDDSEEDESSSKED